MGEYKTVLEIERFSNNPKINTRVLGFILANGSNGLAKNCFSLAHPFDGYSTIFLRFCYSAIRIPKVTIALETHDNGNIRFRLTYLFSDVYVESFNTFRTDEEMDGITFRYEGKHSIKKG